MKKNRQQGFTLIEIIASLVLMGVILAVAGMGVISGIEGYLLARENSIVAQKAQMAMGRLTRELRECFDCSTPSPAAITLPFTFENLLGNREIGLSGNTITLGTPGDTDPLIDQIQSFSMQYISNGRIDISFTLAYQSNNATVDFQTSVLPRNTY